MTSIRGKVSNEVLLEKVNQVNDKVSDIKERQEKIETKVEQNFSSLANVLKEGYVTREEYNRLQLDIGELKRTKVDEISIRPYLWVLKTVGALSLTGLVYLVGKIITDYIKGNVPQ